MCDRYASMCKCGQCQRRARHETTLRTTCAACQGSTATCIGGSERPSGCNAFTPDGALRPLPKPIRQPWEAKAA